jgi:hypothetical protein
MFFQLTRFGRKLLNPRSETRNLAEQQIRMNSVLRFDQYCREECVLPVEIFYCNCCRQN